MVLDGRGPPVYLSEIEKNRRHNMRIDPTKMGGALIDKKSSNTGI
jgi:hypothetical protein